MREIEILIPVKSSFKETRAILSQFGRPRIKHVVDQYYYDPLRKDLRPTKNGRLKRVLRIRQANNKCYLTYKVDHFISDDIWSHSDEHEVMVSNGKVLTTILNHLQLQKMITVDNSRYYYNYQNYEIVLEKVKNLGLFLEVEYRGKSRKKTSTIKKDIWSFIQSLGLSLGKECNAGKPELLLRKSTLKP